MSLGIFVEGPSDKQTIPILIQKLDYRASIHTRIVPQGNMLNVSRMSKHISALIRDQAPLQRIVVFIDSEGVAPEQTMRRTQPTSRQLNRESRVPVEYVVVDHSIEGWLACDTDALRHVLGPTARIRIRGNPEENLRPARLLDRVFRDNGKDFVKTIHNKRIAEHVEAPNILVKSPTFGYLRNLLAG